jgi:hypothetical protein
MWVLLQIQSLSLFIYSKSCLPIINYTQVFFVGYNYAVNFKKFSYNLNTAWADSFNPNLFYNYKETKSYKLTNFKGIFGEGVNLNFFKVNNSFNVFNQILLILNFLFFGLYREIFYKMLNLTVI